MEEIFTLPPTLAQKDALSAINNLVRRRVAHFVESGVEPGKLETQPIKEIRDKVGEYKSGAVRREPAEPSGPTPRDLAIESLLGGLSDGFTPAPIDTPAPRAGGSADDATKATLTAWLESNLPRLVEEMVRSQIKDLPAEPPVNTRPKDEPGAE